MCHGFSDNNKELTCEPSRIVTKYVAKMIDQNIRVSCDYLSLKMKTRNSVVLNLTLTTYKIRIIPSTKKCDVLKASLRHFATIAGISEACRILLYKYLRKETNTLILWRVRIFLFGFHWVGYETRKIFHN